MGFTDRKNTCRPIQKKCDENSNDFSGFFASCLLAHCHTFSCQQCSSSPERQYRPWCATDVADLRRQLELLRRQFLDLLAAGDSGDNHSNAPADNANIHKRGFGSQRYGRSCFREVTNTEPLTVDTLSARRSCSGLSSDARSTVDNWQLRQRLPGRRKSWTSRPSQHRRPCQCRNVDRLHQQHSTVEVKRPGSSADGASVVAEAMTPVCCHSSSNETAVNCATKTPMISADEETQRWVTAGLAIMTNETEEVNSPRGHGLRSAHKEKEARLNDDSGRSPNASSQSHEGDSRVRKHGGASGPPTSDSSNTKYRVRVSTADQATVCRVTGGEYHSGAGDDDDDGDDVGLNGAHQQHCAAVRTASGKTSHRAAVKSTAENDGAVADNIRPDSDCRRGALRRSSRNWRKVCVSANGPVAADNAVDSRAITRLTPPDIEPAIKYACRVRLARLSDKMIRAHTSGPAELTETPAVQRAGVSRRRKRRRGVGDCFSLLRKRKRTRTGFSQSKTATQPASQSQTASRSADQSECAHVSNRQSDAVMKSEGESSCALQNIDQSRDVLQSHSQSNQSNEKPPINSKSEDIDSERKQEPVHSNHVQTSTKRHSPQKNQSNGFKSNADQSEALLHCPDQSGSTLQSTNQSNDAVCGSDQSESSAVENIQSKSPQHISNQSQSHNQNALSLSTKSNAGDISPETCDDDDDDEQSSSSSDDDDDTYECHDGRPMITILPPVANTCDRRQQWRTIDLPTRWGIVQVSVIQKQRTKDQSIKPLSKTIRNKLGFTEHHHWLEPIQLRDVIKYICVWPRPLIGQVTNENASSVSSTNRSAETDQPTNQLAENAFSSTTDDVTQSRDAKLCGDLPSRRISSQEFQPMDNSVMKNREITPKKSANDKYTLSLSESDSSDDNDDHCAVSV